MSTTSKIMGLVAGVSAVAAIGVAVAQGVPPDARISNPALGAGQQSTHVTAMGDSGVPTWENEPRVAIVPATIIRQEEVAVVEQPVALQTTELGAGPAPEPETVAQAPIARADRN